MYPVHVPGSQRIGCFGSTFLNSCEIYQKPRLLPTLQLFLYREFSPLIFSSTGWRFAMWNMRQVNISWNLRCDCHNYPRRIIQDRLNMSRILQYILCFALKGSNTRLAPMFQSCGELCIQPTSSLPFGNITSVHMSKLCIPATPNRRIFSPKIWEAY